MRKTKKTDTNIGHIDVYKVLHGCQQGVNRLEKKFTEIQNKKGGKK